MIEITIPVYNEEETLENQINTILVFINQKIYKKLNISLVIADNGSTDKTKEIGLNLAAENKKIKYLRTPKPGVGLALKNSWKKSNAYLVGYMDLDLSTNLNHLSEVFDLILNKKIDLVSGSRLNKKSIVKKRKLLRFVTSVSFNIIVKLLFKTSFEDGMCGFKFFKRKLLPNLMKKGAVSDGWFYVTELLIVAERLGFKHVDIPIKWTDTENSKVKIVKLTIEYLKAMLILKRKLTSK